jgi:hypothetical protein
MLTARLHAHRTWNSHFLRSSMHSTNMAQASSISSFMADSCGRRGGKGRSTEETHHELVGKAVSLSKSMLLVTQVHTCAFDQIGVRSSKKHPSTSILGAGTAFAAAAIAAALQQPDAWERAITHRCDHSAVLVTGGQGHVTKLALRRLL